MFPVPLPLLTPNTYAYESQPMVKPTGFREYDARWMFGKEINLMGVQALGMGLGTLLGERGINIATFALGRSAPGEDAIALVGIDAPADEQLIRDVGALPNVIQAKPLRF